jgi:hypothetical protein
MQVTMWRFPGGWRSPRNSGRQINSREDIRSCVEDIAKILAQPTLTVFYPTKPFPAQPRS